MGEFLGETAIVASQINAMILLIDRINVLANINGTDFIEQHSDCRYHNISNGNHLPPSRYCTISSFSLIKNY